MDKKKETLLIALKKSRGNISKACDAVKISRQTYYVYRDNDPDFKDKAENVVDANIDYVENRLMDLIDEGNPTAIIFYLKTKGKNRGYSEKIEVDSTGGLITWNEVKTYKKEESVPVITGMIIKDS